MIHFPLGEEGTHPAHYCVTRRGVIYSYPLEIGQECRFVEGNQTIALTVTGMEDLADPPVVKVTITVTGSNDKILLSSSPVRLWT